MAAAATAELGALPAGATSFGNVEGLGVHGVVDGAGGTTYAVVVGRPALLAEWSQPLPTELATALDAAEADGPHRSSPSAGTAPPAGCSSSPTPSSRPAPRRSRELRDLGLRPVLLTGDNAAAAQAVGREVGIAPQDVVAGVLPAGKVDVVRRLQAEGHVVAMVGDGVNDAAALAAADLGLAMGTGTDVAMEASDLTLVRGDLRVAADAIRLSRARCGPSRRTWPGRSGTTSPRCRWRPRGCSTR